MESDDLLKLKAWADSMCVHTAAGHLETILELLKEAPALAKKHGVSEAELVDIPDSSGFTPLIKASQVGVARAVDAFLSHSANVHARTVQGNTALMYACAQGHRDVVDRLLSACACCAATTNSNDDSAIMFAAMGGHIDIIRRVLESLESSGAAGNGGEDRRKHESRTSMVCGAASLLRLHNKSGMTAFMCAASCGHAGALAALIDAYMSTKGADDPDVAKTLDAQENFGRTALHFAAASGHTACVCVLLERGASPFVSDSQGRRAADCVCEANDVVSRDVCLAVLRQCMSVAEARADGAARALGAPLAPADSQKRTAKGFPSGSSRAGILLLSSLV